MPDDLSPKPDSAEGPILTRRSLLLGGAAAGAVLLYGAGPAGAMRAAPRAFKRTSAGTVTFGSNGSDAVPKKAYANVMANFTKKTGIAVKVNTVDHNTFQEQINSYLQGKPDDVFTWFAGYRMQFFAQKGLATPIDDVWKTLDAVDAAGHEGRLDRARRARSTSCRSTTTRGRSSTARASSRRTATRCRPRGTSSWPSRKKMKSDGLIPIAFTDKDGWPAMGTFDILNMRINGYQFHVDLMAGKEAWDGAKVKAVFDQWKELLPYYSPGALGLTWQEGAQQVVSKQAGMFLLGSFVGQQFTNPSDHADLDFFAYPSINSKWGQDSARRPDRRLHAVRRASRQRRRQGAARLSRERCCRKHISRDRLERRRREQAGEPRALQRAAEEGRRHDRVGKAHRAVHGPGHAAGLRLHGDDPVAAVLPEQPEQRQLAGFEHREAEEGDLRHLSSTRESVTTETPAIATDGAPRRRRAVRLSLSDRITLGLMVAIPVLIVSFFIWFPTVSSIVLSFSSWDGIGGIGAIKFIGTRNYHQIATIYPPFWPAFRHNLYWLVFLAVIATPLGLLLAYLLDKEIRGTRIYQSIFFLPVVLSLAIIGFIWELIYSPTQGLLNNVFEDPAHGHLIDWLGNPQDQPLGDPGRRRMAPRRLHDDHLSRRAEGRRPVAARGGCDRRGQRVACRSGRSSSRRSSRSTSWSRSSR